MQISVSLLLLFCSSLLVHFNFCHGNQAENLMRLINSRKSRNPSASDSWRDVEVELNSLVTPLQDGLMQEDKIKELPGQPLNVNFNQYSGYITIDQQAGKALFYYFVESPENSSTKPLVLWLNGGPGCSSLFGAMQELGPFGVKSDGKTLYRNKYAWNNVANVLFLESPIGVGFSYSNTTSDYDHLGDKQTAKDSYVFLVNWLERFPSYKNREFYITGESYAGHYVPQLAYTILQNNKNNYNQPIIINIKGIAIGNAYFDLSTTKKGTYDFLWRHALNSDATHEGITNYCNFSNDLNLSEQCNSYVIQSNVEIGSIDRYNIYAPLCHVPLLKDGSTNSETVSGPCQDVYVDAYLNLPEVQTALHAKHKIWSSCSGLHWNDFADTTLPIIENLFSNNISVWIYSGDMDSIVSVTTTKYDIKSLKLPVETPWRPWYTKDGEVGGYVEGYKGVTFVTVRGSGHMVPADQPERALTMISAFFQGIPPPSKDM